MNSNYLTKEFLEREAKDIILNIINKYTNRRCFIMGEDNIINRETDKKKIIIGGLVDYIFLIHKIL